MPERRRWETWASLDEVTPVVRVDESAEVGRPQLLLIEDKQRRRLSALLDREEEREVAVRDRSRRQRWHEQTWARFTAVAAGIGAFLSGAAAWYAILTRH